MTIRMENELTRDSDDHVKAVRGNEYSTWTTQCPYNSVPLDWHATG
jgi:hypothetical protein